MAALWTKQCLPLKWTDGNLGECTVLWTRQPQGLILHPLKSQTNTCERTGRVFWHSPKEAVLDVLEVRAVKQLFLFICICVCILGLPLADQLNPTASSALCLCQPQVPCCSQGAPEGTLPLGLSAAPHSPRSTKFWCALPDPCLSMSFLTSTHTQRLW